ncbi:MAG: hypothetical protein H7146_01975, partial [Burkholderiaceae bacterium]|nr:hypothetical protein [Microbacteriaceae bacterium]
MSERIDPRDPGAGVSGGAAAGAAGDDMPAEIVPMSLALTFERLAVVVETWNGAVETWNGAVEGCGPVTASSPGFELRDGFRPSAVALDVERMSDTALLEATRSLFGVNAPVQALLTRVAGEIAHRSRRSLGVEGVAKNAGHPNAASLVAELGAIPFGEAQRLCKVGAATAVQRSLLGGRGEPEYPVLAAAVDDAEVGVAAASHIITNLGQATSRALRQDMDAAEAKLVEFAKTSLPETVRKL